MSSGQNPLVLMMALSLPGAAHALGLGDIHVDSKLNEPLAAQIDIVGATAEELAALSAAVANRETFVRYGAERPAFLSSTTFKVTHDSLGHPALAVRSSESFTDPLVNFLVDLRWHNGELVREYTLLLDPAVFASASRAADIASAPAVQAAPAAQATPAVQTVPAVQVTPAVQAMPAVQATPAVQAMPAVQVVPAPLAAPRAQAVARIQAAPVIDASTIETAQPTLARKAGRQANNQNSSSAKRAGRKVTHYKVGAKGTLRGIAWRAGARSEPDLQRLMIAIFRANPTAFEGNINRLHRGAVLSIPGSAEVSAISRAEASREIELQMAAWHAAGKTIGAGATAPPTALADARPDPIASNDPTVRAWEATDSAALSGRVKSLEQELHEMQRMLENEHDKLLGVQLQVGHAEKSASAAGTGHSPVISGSSRLGSLVAALGILGGAFGALYFWVRRRSSKLIDSHRARPTAHDVPLGTAIDSIANNSTQGNAQGAVQVDAQDSSSVISKPADDDETMPLPVIRDGDQSLRSEAAGPADRAAAFDEATVTLPAAPVNLPVDTLSRVDAGNLDYNFVDLETTAQHVQMPSVLHEHVVVKERRTNIVDVLRAALAREPDRHDLRLKLLELYYAAAATNRQGFLEVVQRLARERNYLSEGEWDKIAFMGRQIASENPLFAETADDDELADCA